DAHLLARAEVAGGERRRVAGGGRAGVGGALGAVEAGRPGDRGGAADGDPHRVGRDVHPLAGDVPVELAVVCEAVDDVGEVVVQHVGLPPPHRLVGAADADTGLGAG